ncbi:MAG: Pr6Pr family membrane protein [Clostridia bacterium]|nr:Pr6Pr family membrane protein [Clostridia bacterium]
MENVGSACNKRKRIIIALNILISVSSLLGVLLSCIFAVNDGYSDWYRRLFYFTQQSNIWIFLTCAVYAAIHLLKLSNTKLLALVDTLKFVFAVSITVTGIIFCALLAPFANFNIWSFANVLTHVITPLLAIFEFFLNGYLKAVRHRDVLLAMIPPALWFVFASILCLLKVDFGKGDPFPYFFMDFYNGAGLFGYVEGMPPKIGVFYWIAFFLLFIYGLGYLYYRLHNRIHKNK